MRGLLYSIFGLRDDTEAEHIRLQREEESKRELELERSNYRQSVQRAASTARALENSLSQTWDEAMVMMSRNPND